MEISQAFAEMQKHAIELRESLSDNDDIDLIDEIIDISMDLGDNLMVEGLISEDDIMAA